MAVVNRGAHALRGITVDIVVPVYNEERDLEPSVRRLRTYLDATFPFSTTVTIADNASTDRTWERACHLASELVGVRALHLDAKGRGRALRAAWSSSAADVVAYMDVDLSTDLRALLPLIAPIASGHSDVAIGSRLARGAQVVRGPKREVISRTYNVLLRVLLRNHFTDAQCGFKALRAEEARVLLPSILDEEWFFDTELLVLAERNGLRIHEVPVDWSDDPDSRVHLAATALADLRGVWRLVREFSAGGGRVGDLEGRRPASTTSNVARFARVGVLSTFAYLVAFILLSSHMNGYVANAVALAASSFANLVAHLRYTFRRPGQLASWTGALGAVLALSTSVVLTTWFLAAEQLLYRGSRSAEIVALLAGNAVAGALRFVLLRGLVFRLYLRSSSEVGGARDISSVV